MKNSDFKKGGHYRKKPDGPADRLENRLWDAARGEKIPLPLDGFEERVMVRIENEKSSRKRVSFLDTLGIFSWRLAPAAAAALILVAVFGTFRPSPAAGQWLILFTGSENMIRWIILGG